MLGAALQQPLSDMPVESQLDNSQATNLFTLRKMRSLCAFHYIIALATPDVNPFAEI